MKYLDLIKAHAKYGNTKENIAAHKGLENVLTKGIKSECYFEKETLTEM